jgi:hypothetical protein
MARKAAADTLILVGSCVRCGTAVWTFREMGMLHLIDPRPVGKAVLRSRTDPKTDPPLVTVTKEGRATAWMRFMTDKPAFPYHEHQSGARFKKPQAAAFWDDSLPPPF